MITFRLLEFTVFKKGIVRIGEADVSVTFRSLYAILSSFVNCTKTVSRNCANEIIESINSSW